MLKHPRTSKSALYSMSIVLAVMTIIAASHYLTHYSAVYPHKKHVFAAILVITASVYVLIRTVKSLMKYTGLYAGVTVFRIKNELITQLKDADFYTPSIFPEYIVLPEIIINLSDDEMTGTIMIENILRYHKRLDDDFSMAFSNYVVDAYYISDDGNWFVYEVLRADYDYKLRFNNFYSFESLARKLPPYTLFVDQNLAVPLQMTMIVGQQGSGKSYASYSIVLQLMLMQSHLYFADPKSAGLKSLGDSIDPDNTAVDFEEICDLLRRFHSVLKERNLQVREALGSHLEGDYRMLNWDPHVLVFEEYSAFQAVLNTREKQIRDEITGIIEQIVFMGRQCGCLMIVIAQQINAQTMPTKIRDQLSAKFLLCRGLETETAVCAFGQVDAADLPKRNAKPGEAYYKIAGINAKPKRCEFPELSFNILQETNNCRRRA